MIDKLRDILRKKYPYHTAEQLEAEIKRRIPEEEVVEETPVFEHIPINAVVVTDEPVVEDVVDEPVVETEEEVDEDEDEVVADDLTQIRGIGKKLKEKLNALGVMTFVDIASLDDSKIQKINSELDFKGRVDYEDWVGQAKDLVE